MKKAFFISIVAILMLVFAIGCTPEQADSGKDKTEKIIVKYDSSEVIVRDDFFGREIPNGSEIDIGDSLLLALKNSDGKRVLSWKLSDKEVADSARDNFTTAGIKTTDCVKEGNSYVCTISVSTRDAYKAELVYDAAKFECLKISRTESYSKDNVIASGTIMTEGDKVYIYPKTGAEDKRVDTLTINGTDRTSDYTKQSYNCLTLTISEQDIKDGKIALDATFRDAKTAVIKFDTETIVVKRQSFYGTYVTGADKEYKTVEASGTLVYEGDHLTLAMKDNSNPTWKVNGEDLLEPTGKYHTKTIRVYANTKDKELIVTPATN